MAYTRVNWEGGEKVSDGYVTIDGQNYTVVEATYSGTTPVDADNLNVMDEGIKELDDCRLKKLWENNQPTADFNAQTINLTSADYDVLIWFFKGYKSHSALLSIETIKGYGPNLMSMGKNSDNNIQVIQRLGSYISDTSYSIPKGTVYTQGKGSNDENTSSCIPIAIYGKKF